MVVEKQARDLGQDSECALAALAELAAVEIDLFAALARRLLRRPLVAAMVLLAGAHRWQMQGVLDSGLSKTLPVERAAGPSRWDSSVSERLWGV